MRNYDFSPLFRSMIGFDRYFDLADSVAKWDDQGYPPYNVQALDENSYRITLAVAGFAQDDLSLEVKDGTLMIAGKKEEQDENVTYLHRGIAGRNFVRRFKLADHIEVTAANLDNGVLSVDLVREIPEALKPKQIPVQTGKATSLVGKAKKLLEGDKDAA